MASDSDSVKIARIDQKVISLDEWSKTHATEDNVRFERTFGYVKDEFQKMSERFDKIDDKLDTLWDDKNKQQGAFSVSKLGVGAVWAGVVLAANWIMNGAHR